jgi:hypothetical protein
MNPMNREHIIREFELFCQQPGLPCEELVGIRISLGSVEINLDTGEVIDSQPPEPATGKPS